MNQKAIKEVQPQNESEFRTTIKYLDIQEVDIPSQSNHGSASSKWGPPELDLRLGVSSLLVQWCSQPTDSSFCRNYVWSVFPPRTLALPILLQLLQLPTSQQQLLERMN
jgi:hypothetical protein